MATNYNPSIVTSGLVLALDAGNTKSYPGTGTTWTDLSGNGYTGTLVNGPTYSSSNGGSIVFDGSNDYVTTNYSAENTYWSFEYAFYFNAFPVGSGTVCAGKYAGGNAIWSGPNNAISLSINGGTISSGITPTSGNWYIVTCILGATGQRLYVNGELKATGSTTTTSPGSVWTLGSFGVGGNYWLNGRIASFKLYNFALDNDQVFQNYSALRGRFGL